MGLQEPVYSFAENQSVHVLLRTAVMSFIQFGVAGLGITLISAVRRESFLSHGLRKKGLLRSLAFCVLAFVPNILFYVFTKQIGGYLPFQSVWMTEELLSSPFPVNAAGLIMIAAAWGFFEGFNYVVISDKVNELFPPHGIWLDWGAIFCGMMCLLIHGMVDITLTGIIEAVTVFIVIYGMLVAKRQTGNAWGCVFIFVFLWNAF